MSGPTKSEASGATFEGRDPLDARSISPDKIILARRLYNLNDLVPALI
jgi:hypothetical protein